MQLFVVFFESYAIGRCLSNPHALHPVGTHALCVRNTVGGVNTSGMNHTRRKTKILATVENNRPTLENEAWDESLYIF